MPRCGICAALTVGLLSACAGEPETVTVRETVEKKVPVPIPCPEPEVRPAEPLTVAENATIFEAAQRVAVHVEDLRRERDALRSHAEACSAGGR